MTLSPIVSAYLSARGLRAKLEVIASHTDDLLSEDTVRQVAALDPGQVPLPELAAELLRFCGTGQDEPVGTFVNHLLNALLAAEVPDKRLMLEHWEDPLVVDEDVEGSLRDFAGTATSDLARSILWHADLLEACRAKGIDAAFDEKIAAMPPPPEPQGISLDDILAELDSLSGKTDRASIGRRVELLTGVLGALDRSSEGAPDTEHETLRVQLLTDLANTIGTAWGNGWIDPAVQAAALDKAHDLFERAMEILHRLGRELDWATTASNRANLYQSQFDAGDTAAADKAHDLYEHAMLIRHRLGRELDWAKSAQNRATLYLGQFEAGDAAAADKAHDLYEQAMEILDRLGRELDWAKPAQNRANLYQRQYDAGDAAAADKAHDLYERAMEIYKRLGRDLDWAQTAQNRATLYKSQFEAGDAAAADKAHDLYERAMDIRKRLGRELDWAQTAQNRANLYQSQFDAGDASTADKAHDLYERAMDIRKRFGRELDWAQTAQNRANLYARQFEAGDAAAADKAHDLYNQAIEIRRRLGRALESAQTLWNRHGLFRAMARATSDDDAQANDLLSRALADVTAALDLLPEGAAASSHLRMRKGQVDLLADLGRDAEALEQAEDLLAGVMDRVMVLPTRTERLALLAELSGLGQTAAALALAQGGPDCAARAAALLESGRARLLNAELSANEARLDADGAAALDTARTDHRMAEYRYGQSEADLGEAIAAADRIARMADAGTPPDPAAVAVVEAARARVTTCRARMNDARDRLQTAHRALIDLRRTLGMDNSLAVASERDLLDAIPQEAAVVLPVPARETGYLLVLSGRDPAAGWQVFDVPGLTLARVETARDDMLALLRIAQYRSAQSDALAMDGFSEVLSLRLGAGLTGETFYNAEDLDDRMIAASARRVMSVFGGAPGYWDLVMGPMCAALEQAGVTPASRGDTIAPEVILCAPAELGMLPLASAVDPHNTAVFDRYALRMVPSLRSVVTSAKRNTDLSFEGKRLGLQDPLGDLLGDRDLRDRLHCILGLSPDVLLTGHATANSADTLATLEGFLAKAAELCPAILTFFGHGLHDPGSGLGSGIALSPKASENGEVPTGPDGKVLPQLGHPEFIRQLQLAATRLVYLICCTGGGLSLGQNRDEMVGLSSAFLEAGAGGVLSTLYPVYAHTAVRMTHTFQECLAQQRDLAKHHPLNSPIAQALRHAQAKLFQNMTAEHIQNPRTNVHPTMHCAAFITVGA